jgi:hypothetical protein
VSDRTQNAVGAVVLAAVIALLLGFVILAAVYN